MNFQQKKEALEKLKNIMEKDNALPLKKGAKQLVFGHGNPDATILFIGEGPGYWEDQKGIPFVGNAGAFLNYLLQLIKLSREEVFITNVVHHRPPNNRDPIDSELKAYAKYLDRIIEIIDPQMIVTLGRFSMTKFIPGVYISRVHGQPSKVPWNDKEIVVVPMYHPAAGLRNGDVKQSTIEDFKKLEGLITKAKSTEEKEAEVSQQRLI